MIAVALALSFGVQWVEPKFENVVPDGHIAPVARTNDRYPLWDQSDKGDWIAYEPMSDEFNGTALDHGKWTDQNRSWHGRQPGWFDSANIEVSSGRLKLTARLGEPTDVLKAEGYKTFSTAALQSRGTVLYGAFEVRARPMKSGVSSAFWFFYNEPTTWTEIDVYEIGGHAKGFERKDHMTVHVFKTPTVPVHHQVGGEFVNDHDWADDYHVYGLEWDEMAIRWYIDGVLVRRGENRYWHQPLTMNFDCETMPEWFGLPDPADLPSTYSVDYVRSWKHRT